MPSFAVSSACPNALAWEVLKRSGRSGKESNCDSSKPGSAGAIGTLDLLDKRPGGAGSLTKGGRGSPRIDKWVTEGGGRTRP